MNGVRQHDVEGRYAVCGDNQQLIPDRVNVPDLAATKKFDTGNICVRDRVNDFASSSRINLSKRVELTNGILRVM
jgi:hypothetical protein